MTLLAVAGGQLPIYDRNCRRQPVGGGGVDILV